VKKKRLQFTIFNKPTGSVQFQFDKPETEKIKPNRTQNRKKKPSQTRTGFYSKKTEPKPVGLTCFLFLKNNLIIFLIKTE